MKARTTQPHMAVAKAGGIQGCPVFLFCCRTLAVAGAWRGGAPGCPVLLFCCRTLAVAEGWWKGRFRMLPASLLLTQSGGCGGLALGWGSGWSGSCGGLATSYFRLFYVAGDGSCDCRRTARLTQGKGARGKPLVSHGSFAHRAKEPAGIIFPAACTSEKYPDPCARGAHTPVTDVTGEGESKGGTPVPSLVQLSFARHSVVIRLKRPRRSSSVMPRLHSRSASSSSAA